MSAGKGSAPRNLGPKFRENYDQIFPQGRRGAEEKVSKRIPMTDSLSPTPRSSRTVPPHP
jgi:hypothetical protein